MFDCQSVHVFSCFFRLNTLIVLDFSGILSSNYRQLLADQEWRENRCRKRIGRVNIMKVKLGG